MFGGEYIRMLSIDGSFFIEGVLGVALLGVLGLDPEFAVILLLFVPDEEVNSDLTLEDARDVRWLPLA